jgi:histidine triad (HIT) family protein
MEDCIFCKIAKGEITTDFLYEDDDVMAFKDIHPVKPVHILIVPKQHIEDFLALEDPLLKEKLLSVVQTMAESAELDDKGFRVTINGGGAQEINHLHIHLMGPMGANAKME